MEKDSVVHKDFFHLCDKEYEIVIYRRGGRHFAKTVFSPEDVIISDGVTTEEVLAKHQRLLPLAINSRQILRELNHKQSAVGI